MGRRGARAATTTTVVVVAYGIPRLDLSWVPAGTPVVVVHNDAALVDVACPSSRVTHVRPGRNLGFGAGVNAALRHVRTERVLLVNPDTVLTPAHWPLFESRDADTVVTVPQRDASGTPNAVVSRYPGPLALLAQAWRLGRLLPRGTRRRALAARCLERPVGTVPVAGPGSEAPEDALLPLAENWVSASLVALDAARLRSVGGFAERYFLYFEDVDLCARLAARHPGMRIRVARGAGPAVHTVGASIPAAGADRVRRIRRASAATYASGRPGWRWSLVRLALALTAPGETRP